MAAIGEPYLSLVVTARNDDHGGNLLGRMQAFVNGWIGQARRRGIPSELIIVTHCAGRQTLARVRFASSRCHPKCTAGSGTLKRCLSIR